MISVICLYIYFMYSLHCDVYMLRRICRNHNYLRKAQIMMIIRIKLFGISGRLVCQHERNRNALDAWSGTSQNDYNRRRTTCMGSITSGSCQLNPGKLSTICSWDPGKLYFTKGGSSWSILSPNRHSTSTEVITHPDKPVKKHLTNMLI